MNNKIVMNPNEMRNLSKKFSSKSEEVRQILSSIIDDLAITIGKLQEGIKIATDSHNEDLITQGQEDIKNITLEGTKEE